MEFITAMPEHLGIAEQIVHCSIRTTYSLYYSQEIVDFFCNRIHTRENILRDISDGNLWLIREHGVFVGTGCVRGSELARLYILPEYQHRGFGSAMMDFMEQKAAEHHDTARLAPSSLAVDFYKRRGYKLVHHSVSTLEHGSELVYDIMEKKLK